MSVKIDPLGWLRWWRQRNTTLQLENVSLEYMGSEPHPEYGLLVSLELQFDLVNTSTTRAEKVSYSLVVETPSPETTTRKYTHTKESRVFDRLESENTFAPLLVRTDFSNVMIFTDDHPSWARPTNIRTVAPASDEVNISLKATSASHRGDEYSCPFMKLVNDWVSEFEGITIAELEEDIMVAWDREPLQEEHLTKIIGDDLTVGDDTRR